MKLFVNGCSFSHGHKDWGKSMLPTDWVWPSLMSTDFDETVNLAWQGGSNHRVVRTTLEFFDKIKDTSDWLAVIQWTTPYSRIELYDTKTKTYFGYCEGSDEPVFDLTANTKFVTIPKDFYRTIALYKQTTIIRSHVDLESNFIHQNFVLSEYFKRRGIKFVFVSLSSHSFIHPENKHPLVKYLARENYLGTTLTSFINPASKHLIESDTDFHPNKAGHRVIANYITKELQTRNYL
jgi:hypothetical protein